MIEIDAKQLDFVQRAVKDIENGVPRVMVPAINRALSSGQTAVRREIRKVYTIKQKDIPTKIHRATRASLMGEIRIEQGMLGAEKFVYRPMFPTKRRRQLYVQIKKGGGGFVRGGFVANKLRGPYQRKTTRSLPIRKIITIGAPIMASQPNVGPAANKVMGDALAKRIDHELQRVMSSAGGH
jgi:hypothetical protein